MVGKRAFGEREREREWERWIEGKREREGIGIGTGERKEKVSGKSSPARVKKRNSSTPCIFIVCLAVKQDQKLTGIGPIIKIIIRSVSYRLKFLKK